MSKLLYSPIEIIDKVLDKEGETVISEEIVRALADAGWILVPRFVCEQAGIEVEEHESIPGSL